VSEREPLLVVGAGPVAAAAATALVAAGRRVVVVDTGLTLEPEREAARRRMAATPPAMWDASDLALSRFQAGGANPSGYKRLFGSDLAFRDDGVLELSADASVGARPSYALGGLSNVWGSGLMPYRDADLAGWPIRAAQLEDGYRAALAFLPFAGEQDELAERYPLHRAPDGPLVRTAAAERILARLRRHRRALEAAGLAFGAARLAVRVGHPAPAAGCVYCGHCLDGCPYGHIYTAAHTIEELTRAGAIEYRPRLHVDRVLERGGEVVVEATHLGGEPGVALRGSRAFLAAGALSSTIILQRSGLMPACAEIADSQALYVPFLWAGRVGRTGREPGHTLAQLTLVLEDPAVAANPVHVSLYTYNDSLAERARASHPRLAALLGPALDSLTRRLAIGICFFHSEDSDRVAVSCEPGGRAVRLDAVPNPGRPAVVAAFGRALLRTLGRVGLVPLLPLCELAPAGGGYHYGASAPMSADPAFGQTDLLGRPAQARRIHVVDSACFPSVPGGSITLSAMANAHRIVTAALEGAHA
jgi:choline dehydrogenase-like flavoprotein